MEVDDLEPFYESYRLGQAPSERQEDEAWSAIVQRIDRGAQGPILEDEAPVSPAPSARWRWRVIGAGAIAAAAALIVAGSTIIEPQVAGLLERTPSGDAASFDAETTRTHDVVERRRRSPGTKRRDPSVSTAGPLAPPTPLVTPMLAEPSEPASNEPVSNARPVVPPSNPKPRSRPREGERMPREIEPQPASAPQPASEPEVAVRSIESEVQLLEDAKRALVMGRPDRALILLRRHRRQFEAGMLSPERDVLEVRALCAVGREPLARKRATESARANPNSPWASTLRRVCADALER